MAGGEQYAERSIGTGVDFIPPNEVIILVGQYTCVSRTTVTISTRVGSIDHRGEYAVIRCRIGAQQRDVRETGLTVRRRVARLGIGGPGKRVSLTRVQPRVKNILLSPRAIRGTHRGRWVLVSNHVTPGIASEYIGEDRFGRCPRRQRNPAAIRPEITATIRTR